MPPIQSLSELNEGDEGIFFALLLKKEALVTRDHKPYFRLTFRDSRREAFCPIWNDSPWMGSCKNDWQAGKFYKLQAIFVIHPMVCS